MTDSKRASSERRRGLEDNGDEGLAADLALDDDFDPAPADALNFDADGNLLPVPPIGDS